MPKSTLQTIRDKGDKEFEIKLKLLHGAIQRYEIAKILDKENNERPLDEQLKVNRLTSEGVKHHTEQIMNEFEKLKSHIHSQENKMLLGVKAWAEKRCEDNTRHHGTAKWNTDLRDLISFIDSFVKE